MLQSTRFSLLPHAISTYIRGQEIQLGYFYLKPFMKCDSIKCASRSWNDGVDAELTAFFSQNIGDQESNSTLRTCSLSDVLHSSSLLYMVR
jgi:hypothetical protein